MTTFKHRTLVLAVVSALTISACGSGSGSGTAASKVTGVITGFGSVFVNGVEYETTSSSVSMEGTSGSESDLKLGMVVTLDGSVNADGKTGKATHIDYADELEGIVSAVNIAADGTGTLTVMGQTVKVDAATKFESKVSTITSIDMLVANNIVEVSGYSAGDGTIYATRVELKKSAMASGDEIEVKGVVAAVDTTAHTFMIGSQMVDYSGAQLEGFASGAPTNDTFVEVKSTAGIVNSILIANKVEVEGDGKKGIDGKSGEKVELEGVVNSIVSATEFVLNGQHVLLDNGTEFEHGSAADIAVDVKLEVKGKLDADGKLLADEVKFRSEGNIEMRGLVSAIDTTASTITVLGVQVKINNLTQMGDERDENGAMPVRYFSINDLAAGDLVKLHVYVDTANALVATQMERDDATTSEVKLEGPVSSVNGTQVVIAGVTVELTGLAVTPAVGDKLEVRGSYANNLLTATSATIDN